MNIKRIFSRVCFYSLKFLISRTVFFDRRLYMKLYNPLLKTMGMEMKGTPRFIASSVKFDDFDLICLGDRLVVSMDVHFLTHDYSSTTALIAIGEKPKTDIGVKRNITVGNNVFIGMRTIILPGTEIGDNVIVGSGSVLRGNIPPFSIVTGNPAQVIGDIREYALKIKNRKDQTLVIDSK